MLFSAVTNTLDEDIDHLDSEEDSVSFICNPFNMVFIKNYNIASKSVKSNSTAQVCFIFLLCMLMTSANKSLKKKNFPSGCECYKTIGSYVSCAFIKIWSTWEVWRALKKLELLLATPWATLTHLSCSPNFLRASCFNERMLMYEPIVNCSRGRMLRHL